MSSDILDATAPKGTGPADFFTGTFASLAADGFLCDQLSQQVVLVDAGAETTAPLVTWHDLNHLLATRPVLEPQLRLYREGRQIPLQAYARVVGESGRRREVLQPERLYAELRDGASLILDSMETLHPPVTAAAEDLVRFVHEPVQANFYATWGTSQGFAAHWDDHDTFVVQIAGAKHWTVYGPSRQFPMRRDVARDDTCPDSVVWEGVLEAGQVLHVPRGWWHSVRGAGDVSRHLTFGFARRTGVDWAEWIVEQLRHQEIFRQDLPRFAPIPAREAHQASLRARLEQVVAASPLEGYFAHWDELVPRRYRFCLPHPVTFSVPEETDTIEFTPVFAPPIREQGDRVTLSAAKKTLTFAPAMAPMLRALATHRRLSCVELRRLSELDTNVFALALEVLVEQDLVTIATDAAHDAAVSS